MQVERYPDAAAFLAATESFLLQAETENNLILGIAHDLARLPPAPAFSHYFVAVRDPGIQMCAFSTIPHRLGITRCDRSPAIALLAQDCYLACPSMRNVLGPEPTITAFMEQLAPHGGFAIVRKMSERIHELREVRPPEPRSPGRLRPASAIDMDRVISWVDAFSAETGESQGDPRRLAESRVPAGQIFLWDDGEPVSMAGWTGKTRHGVRINLVYTPKERRERGYASCCVAELSSLMLKAGNDYCCLYTDLGNPTANAIYRNIGYRPVADATMYTLAV